jgi:hypothetical protein
MLLPFAMLSYGPQPADEQADAMACMRDDASSESST